MTNTNHPSELPRAPSGPDAVSPELALVDPDLRRQAQDALPVRPERPATTPRREPPPESPRSAAAVPSLDQLPPYPDESTPTTATPRPKRRRRRRLVLAGLALLAAAGVALAVAEATVVERRPAGRVGGAALQPSPPNAADAQSQAPRRQAATTTVAPAETNGSIRTETAAPNPPAQEDVHWTFVWPAVAGADYYNVRFSRAGRTILEAWPRRPRLVVPERGVSRGRAFRFTRGRYRWVVRPGFGRRSRRDYGRAVVLSTWTVAR